MKHHRGMRLSIGRVGAKVAIVGCSVAVALSGCSSGTAPTTNGVSTSTMDSAEVATQTWRPVPPQQFEEYVAEPDRVTINVHIPYEGDIAGTDLSIPFDQVTAQRDSLPAALDTPIAVYCRSGRMSEIAATTLSDMGYQDVVELSGGTKAWEQSGRTLVWR